MPTRLSPLTDHAGWPAAAATIKPGGQLLLVSLPRIGLLAVFYRRPNAYAVRHITTVHAR